MDDNKIFIIGANGQLGLALQRQYPNAKSADIDTLDITDLESVESFDWSNIDIILNAAAFTNVDGAETEEGRVASWKVNASAVSNLTRVCRKYDMTMVHISSDYVFDGTQKPHTEDEPLSPLSVYGQSKAAGDLLVEQLGRLTFTSELVRIIDHLLSTKAPFGTYNATNDGPLASWADITRKIFELSNHKDLIVSNTTTAEYFANKPGVAPRPLNSDMSLDKLHSTGFKSRNWEEDLRQYISNNA